MFNLNLEKKQNILIIRVQLIFYVLSSSRRLGFFYGIRLTFTYSNIIILSKINHEIEIYLIYIHYQYLFVYLLVLALNRTGRLFCLFLVPKKSKTFHILSFIYGHWTQVVNNFEIIKYITIKARGSLQNKYYFLELTRVFHFPSLFVSEGDKKKHLYHD